MKFRINPGVNKIASPIDGDEKCFENGAVLADYEFDKLYVI